MIDRMIMARLSRVEQGSAMVRADLIKLIAAEWPDLPLGDVDKIVTEFFHAITTRLADGGRVEIRRFGVFTTRARDARSGRDQRTGASVEVNARRVPWFKAGKDLCELINGAGSTAPDRKGMGQD
ncbi:HU family DNA-binding protein [Sphingomonas sp. UYP23]